MKSLATPKPALFLLAIFCSAAFSLNTSAQSSGDHVIIDRDGQLTPAETFRYVGHRLSLGELNHERNFNIVAPEAAFNLIRTHPNYGALLLLRWRPVPGEPDRAHWMFGVDEFLGTGGFSITDRLRGDARRLSIHPDGNVGIGTITPTHRLSVNGSIRAKEIIVDSEWADHVFADDYQLMPLTQLASYIQEHRRLPGLPSADEVASNGIGLAEANVMLLEKIEELTMHILALNQRISQLETLSRH